MDDVTNAWSYGQKDSASLIGAALHILFYQITKAHVNLFIQL